MNTFKGLCEEVYRINEILGLDHGHAGAYMIKAQNGVYCLGIFTSDHGAYSQVGSFGSAKETAIIIRGVLHGIVAARAQLAPLTVEIICQRVAEHYTKKLNGKVTCEYLTYDYPDGPESSRQGKFEIHGRNLPPHPDLKERHPNGWEMLDHLTLEEALRIYSGGERHE